MLHLVQNYKKLFVMLACSPLDNWETVASDISSLKQDEVWKYLKDNTKAVLDYINSLDITDASTFELDNWELVKDGKISTNELRDYKNLDAFEKILKELGLDKQKLIEWVELAKVVELVREYSLSRQWIITESTEQRKFLISDVEPKIYGMLDKANFQYFSKIINRKSPISDRKWIQGALNEFGYDISYYSERRWKTIHWLEAIDGDLWPAFRRAIKEFQKDIWVKQTWKLDQQTVDRVNMLLNTKTQKEDEEMTTWALGSAVTGGFVINNWGKTTVEWWVEDKKGAMKTSDARGKEHVEDEEVKDSKGKKPEKIKTAEKQGGIDVVFGWKDLGKELWDNVNKESLDKLLSNMEREEFSAFYLNLNELKKDGMYTPWNISELAELFEEKWYEPDTGVFDWWLWGIEMASLVSICMNIRETQMSTPDMWFKEKASILFDYNSDGTLDDNIFYTYENEIYNAIKTEEHLNNLLVNLWYNPVDFNIEFISHYYNTKKEFKSRLATAGDRMFMVDPIELLNNSNALKEFNDNLKQINWPVEDAIDNYEKTKDLPIETKKLIKLHAVSLILWEINWVYSSLNIKELTNSILDTVTFWYVNWYPWIGISWDIIRTENGRFVMNLWLMNTIPYVWAKWLLMKWDIWEME